MAKMPTTPTPSGSQPTTANQPPKPSSSSPTPIIVKHQDEDNARASAPKQESKLEIQTRRKVIKPLDASLGATATKSGVARSTNSTSSENVASTTPSGKRDTAESLPNKLMSDKAALASSQQTPLESMKNQDLPTVSESPRLGEEIAADEQLPTNGKIKAPGEPKPKSTDIKSDEGSSGDQEKSSEPPSISDIALDKSVQADFRIPIKEVARKVDRLHKKNLSRELRAAKKRSRRGARPRLGLGLWLKRTFVALAMLLPVGFFSYGYFYVIQPRTAIINYLHALDDAESGRFSGVLLGRYSVPLIGESQTRIEYDGSYNQKSYELNTNIVITPISLSSPSSGFELSLRYLDQSLFVLISGTWYEVNQAQLPQVLDTVCNERQKRELSTKALGELISEGPFSDATRLTLPLSSPAEVGGKLDLIKSRELVSDFAHAKASLCGSDIRRLLVGTIHEISEIFRDRLDDLNVSYRLTRSEEFDRLVLRAEAGKDNFYQLTLATKEINQPIEIDVPAGAVALPPELINSVTSLGSL